MQFVPNLILKTIIFCVRFYQLSFSRLKPACCRYYPNCSTYFIQAVQKYRYKGLWLGVKRISRCHPFNPGGIDELK